MKKLLYILSGLFLSSTALANNSTSWPIYPNYFNTPSEARALLGTPGSSENATITGNWIFTGSNSTFGSLVNPGQTSITINNSVNATPATPTGSYGVQVGTFVTDTTVDVAQFFTGIAMGTQAYVNKGGVGTTLSANANNATAAGSFVVGHQYGITTIGNTDFTLIGASANTVALIFVATGVGSGTGTASDAQLTIASSTGILVGDGLRILTGDKFYTFTPVVTGPCAGSPPCVAGVPVNSNVITIDRQVFTTGGISSGAAVLDYKGIADSFNTDVILESPNAILPGTSSPSSLSGATNWFGAISGAIGVVIETGASAAVVSGISVEYEHNSASCGLLYCNGFQVTAESGTEQVPSTIYDVNNSSGRFPADENTWINQSHGNPGVSIAGFIDYHGLACSQFEIWFSNYTVDCAGSSTSLVLKHTQEELDLSYNVAVPTTGGTVNIVNGIETQIINPAGTLSTLTLNLPACNGPNSGYVSRFITTKAITTLTMGNYLGVGSINVPFTSLAANDSHAYFCYGGVQYKMY